MRECRGGASVSATGGSSARGPARAAARGVGRGGFERRHERDRRGLDRLLGRRLRDFLQRLRQPVVLDRGSRGDDDGVGLRCGGRLGKSIGQERRARLRAPRRRAPARARRARRPGRSASVWSSLCLRRRISFFQSESARASSVESVRPPACAGTRSPSSRSRLLVVGISAPRDSQAARQRARRRPAVRSRRARAGLRAGRARLVQASAVSFVITRRRTSCGERLLHRQHPAARWRSA